VRKSRIRSKEPRRNSNGSSVGGVVQERRRVTLDTNNDELVRSFGRSSTTFAAPIHLSCGDHNGHNLISVVQWDGAKWKKTPGSLEPIKDKVMPLIDSAAQDYVKANAGWPKRTEACDKVAAK
jgi:hypothetical protein